MTTKSSETGPLSEARFVKKFGDVYEKSPWVAHQAWWNEGAGLSDVRALATAMRETVDEAPAETKLALLRAHPDLAGRAAQANELTQASSSEQAGAGLDQCTADELQAFQALNSDYKAKFGFPFIVAVAGMDRAQILAQFRQRLTNPPTEELDTAIAEVHKIAWLRLQALDDQIND